MSRPKKCRRVSFIPEVTYFKPAGIPLRILDGVTISVDEAEAIRLKDLEGLEQEECGERMNVSRPTLQRILGSARGKIADALLNGKAIKIGGGNFDIATNRFRCTKGHEWNAPFDPLRPGHHCFCPTCNTTEITIPKAPRLGQNQVGREKSNRGRHCK